MNAVRIHEYGDSGVLRYEEAPRPEPGDGEVVIQVKATSVNPFDHGVRPGFVTSAPPISETLSRLADMVEAGHLAPEVSSVLPLSEVRRAHDEVAKRHTRGKVVVEVA